MREPPESRASLRRAVSRSFTNLKSNSIIQDESIVNTFIHNGKGMATAPAAPAAPASTADTDKFNFDEAFKKLLQNISVNPSPMGKLRLLYDFELMIVSSLSAKGIYVNTPGSMKLHRSKSNMASVSSDTTPSLNMTILPSPMRDNYRTASLSLHQSSTMNSLSEQIASIEAKRTSSGVTPILGSQYPFPTNIRSSSGPSTDAIIEETRRVLFTSELGSKTLFRDLQFIASFVPATILDMTDYGKAFWDVCLAALSLKEEILRIIVDTAGEIFQYNTGMISMDTMDQEFLSQYSLKDVAKLWTIASKEGDVTGQRELAIMYMSHPDLTPICLSPFSKVSEIFDSSLLEDTKVLEDLDKYDPIKMAVIKHWMGRAASYGDVIASEYLMQQEPSVM